MAEEKRDAAAPAPEPAQPENTQTKITKDELEGLISIVKNVLKKLTDKKASSNNSEQIPFTQDEVEEIINIIGVAQYDEASKEPTGDGAATAGNENPARADQALTEGEVQQPAEENIEAAERPETGAGAGDDNPTGAATAAATEGDEAAPPVAAQAPAGAVTTGAAEDRPPAAEDGNDNTGAGAGQGGKKKKLKLKKRKKSNSRKRKNKKGTKKKY